MIFRKFTCFLLLFFSSSGLFGEESELALPGADLRFQRTQFFEIYSEDQRSLRAWRHLAAETETTAAQFLQFPGQFPQRIVILLRNPEDFEQTDRFYRIEERTGFRVFVEVRWDQNLSELQARRILTEALLWRWARWQRIPLENANDAPLWFTEALVLESASRGEISWRSGMMDYLQAEGPSTLSELVRPNRVENLSRHLRYSAALLLRYLHSEGRQARFLETYLLRILRGEDSLEGLKAVFGERMGDQENPELWWLTGATELIWNRTRGIQRAETTSLEWLEQRRLLFVDAKGERRELFPHAWWEYREDPMVRFLLERRLQRLSFQLEQIHPFYFNAFLGMGRLTDAVLSGEEERAFQLLELMEQDFESAERLRREMHQILDQWESRQGE